MAENKKAKKNTTKKVESNKTTTQKKVTKGQPTAKKVTPTPQAKKAAPTQKKASAKKNPVKTTSKKVETKKTVTKEIPKKVKEAPKKVAVKEVPKKIEESPVKEEQLEKTLIFDGRQNKNLAEVVEKLEEDNVVLEDKVLKRSKGKKIAVIILTALIFTVIAATTIYVVVTEIEKAESRQTLNSNVHKKVSRNYKTIGAINAAIKEESESKSEAEESIKEIDYSNIKTITLAEFEKKILEKEDMTILIASTTCYPCITFEPIINEVFKKVDKTIYRINITALTEKENARFRTYYHYTSTPTIFTIKDGIVKAQSVGMLTEEELTTWVKNNI